MGRYYSGDIEGKFWFGVQSSNDGEFFGAEENTSRISYYADDLETAKKGVKECIDKLGDNLQKLDTFFEAHNGYNDEMLESETGIKNVKEVLVWYARLQLGRKIVECIEENDYCEFEAEL